MDENTDSSRQQDNRQDLNDGRKGFVENGAGISPNSGGNADAAAMADSRIYLILGWISTAFALVVSPYFAAAGIFFGVLVNRRARGSGNAVIITSVAFALFNFILRLVFPLLFLGILAALRRSVAG